MAPLRGEGVVKLYELCRDSERQKKCTPEQITNYQLSLIHYRIINVTSDPITTDTARVLYHICTRRQIFFETFKTNRFKIGMNATENKF